MECLFYDKLDNLKVRCNLCPNFCVVSSGCFGRCNVRFNDKGVFKSFSYSKVSSIAIDPIEKKPLYHFLPGSKTLSFGTYGCNLSCDFCQNYSISQSGGGEFRLLSPQEIVDLAVLNGVESISYTYNEPTVFFEFMFETMKIAKLKGLKNVVVSNGFINLDPLKLIVDYVDAVNIDIKSMDDEFYKKFCSVNSVSPVLDCIKFFCSNNVHVEVTHLVIFDDNIDELCEFVSSLDVVLHLSAFYPVYKMVDGYNGTSESRLVDLRDKCLDKGVKYVYLGNTNVSNDTLCECGAVLVKRDGYDVFLNYKDGICLNCGCDIMHLIKINIKV
jgi:pyruvate formate lyase activating enzyme